MADEEPLLRIAGEEDAWRAFEDALNRQFSDESRPTIVWSGWPNVEVYLPETPVEGSISASMMEAFLELQKAIYRSHSLLSSGSEDLRHLTNIEKEQFEIRVQVEKGSSGYKIDLQKILEQLGNDIVAKMTGPELIIVVLGIALIIGGVVVTKAYFQNKVDLKKLQSDDEKTKQLLENYEKQLDNDTKRYKMLTDAISERPVLRQIEDQSNHARDEIVKAVADENGGKVMGIPLPKAVANEISSTVRQQSYEATLTGAFNVAKVDTTAPDGFRVTFDQIGGGEQITASLVDAVISAEHKIAIQEAEWSKRPVVVELKGRSLRGRLMDAKVISVRKVDPQA